MQASSYRFLLVIMAVLAAACADAKLSFTGTSLPSIEISPASSTGLDAIYVINDASSVEVVYTSSSNNVVWSRYDSRGGGFAEQINDVKCTGNTYSIAASTKDEGYIIDDGDRRYCFWVVNYADHTLQLDGLEYSSDSDCSNTVLIPTGKGGDIVYYTINGRSMVLSRELKLEYRTLAYDESSAMWREEEKCETLASLKSVISVSASLCNTDYTLSGDRFLETWGETESVTSDVISARAVSAVTTAEQEERDISNESKSETTGFGGSAPCVMTFKAVATDAAIFKEWQFSDTETFDDIFNRFQQDELTYTFVEEGDTYVRYVCSDDNGDCFYTGDVYTISIGTSKLEVPNAFSPGNQDGVNDEWKVSFTSIVSFECHIFNRWGNKIATLTDPSQGWDGKYKGKLVPSGVYFYVIKAKGADGKKYSLSGDINILNSRQNTQQSITN